MKKRVGILWSGGVDSTYLVYKNLLLGNNVALITVTLSYGTTLMMEAEKIARANLLIEFQNMFARKLITTRDAGNFPGYSSVVSLAHSGLPPIWIMGAVYASNDLDEIQLGYVSKDRAVSYLEDIKNLYYSYQPFVGGKLPRLKFPLTKIDKGDIHSKLPKALLKHTWWCEFPISTGGGYIPCLKCNSCKTVIAL